MALRIPGHGPPSEETGGETGNLYVLVRTAPDSCRGSRRHDGPSGRNPAYPSRPHHIPYNSSVGTTIMRTPARAIFIRFVMG
jgi:hypothetical protein